jgi:phosphoribosyl-ATP pyrophosphohydrolase/phosphoribosyl-AMP cyclohydrolase
MDIKNIKWNDNGLIPAVIQDVSSLNVLMLGYMSSESLKVTVDTNEVTFFSRSKQRLWTKGETSGNKLQVNSIELDCDRDTLLIKATPLGPT